MDISHSEIISESFKSTGNNSTILFKDSLNLSNPVQAEMGKAATNIANDTSVQNEAGRLADRAQQKIKENKSYNWGIDMVSGLGDGIAAAGEGKSFTSKLAGLANKVASYIHFSRPDVGPLHEYEKWMPDMVQGLSKTLKSSSPLLEKSALQLSQKLKDSLDISRLDFGNTNLSAKIIDRQKTIFTTPQIVFNVQELDEAKLQQCFNYINKKFGSAY